MGECGHSLIIGRETVLNRVAVEVSLALRRGTWGPEVELQVGDRYCEWRRP